MAVPATPTGERQERFATPALMPPLTFPLLAGFDRGEGALLQVIDGGLEITPQMEVITAARDLGESQLLAGAEATVAIGDCGRRREAVVDQLQQPDASGLGVAMIFQTQQVAEG